MASKQPKIGRLACALTVLGLLAVLLPGSADAQSTRSRLDAQKERVSRLKANYERIAAAYAETQHELEQTRNRLVRTKTEISRGEREMQQLRKQLKDRVRAAYRMRGVGFFQFLLEADSFREFSVRLMSLQQQTLNDEGLILKLRKKQHELEVRKGELNQQESALSAQKAAEEEQASRLTISLQQANQLARELRAQLSREQIQRLFRVTRAVGGSASGMTVPMDTCPVAGPRAFSNDYGAPRGGGRRRHQGNDIMAPHGTPIVAVGPGTVTRTGNGGLGGLTVYLFSRGTEFYYAHLSRISVRAGQSVSSGQTLGANGNSGNARGGAPHLHFEVHPGGGRPINPYPSLIRVC